MKRILALMLALALMLSLASCSKPVVEPEETDKPVIPEKSDVPDTPEVPEEEDNGNPGFCLLAEHNRLYFQPIDGSDAVLLCDAYAISFDHNGSIVYAVFIDGSIHRFDLVSHTETIVYDNGELYNGEMFYPTVYAYDGGCVYTTPSLFVYDEAIGETNPLYPDNYMSNVDVFGNTLSMELDNQSIFFDLKNHREIVLPPFPKDHIRFIFNKTFYFVPYDGGPVLRFNEKTMQFDELDDIIFDANDFDGLMFISENGYLVSKWSGGNCYYYYISADERTKLDLPSKGFINVVDICDEYVLLEAQEYIGTGLDDDSHYYCYSYYIVSSDGTVTPFNIKGKYSSMFADGDFPVMDSSTARRPITSDIYSFFCLESGAGGAAPLCSTTHNAWLNIADGTADIALLAAPTEEEQAYLDEKGISVDMKLYGGDGLVFIANKACGVENLTLDDIRAIYRGEITNWAELGGVDHEINVCYRDDQSGSQRLFEKLVWKDENVPDFAELGFTPKDEMSSIVDICITSPYTIGYSIMTYLNDVYSNADLLTFSLDGAAATPENIKSGSYPLGTQGYVVIRSDEPADSPARRLYDWFGSPLADRILEENAVTPLGD